MNYIVLLVIIGIFLLLFASFFIVKQQTIAIVERFGKFSRDYGAGINIKIPLIDKIAGRVNLRIQQLDVIVETKTKDDVFVHLKISVQFQIKRGDVYNAFYKLQNPHEQITAFIFDVVRAEVPKMILDSMRFHRGIRLQEWQVMLKAAMHGIINRVGKVD